MLSDGRGSTPVQPPAVTAGSDLRGLIAALDRPEARACGIECLARLRDGLAQAALVEAGGQTRILRGERALGVVHPHGSVSLYLEDPVPLRHRLLDVDAGGSVTLAVRRGGDTRLRELRVRGVDGTWLGVLPGGATHPLWGASDRIVRFGPERGAEHLTVCAAVDWSAIGAIPPLAEPARLPAGGGTAILNALAALAADQVRGPLRYRGPYPTEQLFWALLESFRLDAGLSAASALDAFAGGAEAAFAAGEMREAPLDWTADPHERRFLQAGVYVQVRDGVEKVHWDGRTYYRCDLPGRGRREHRVVRPEPAADGGRRFVVAIEALGHPIENHLLLDASGHLLEGPGPGSGAGPGPEVALDRRWVEALGALLPLEATPLLAGAMAVAWPAFAVTWGPVSRDLIETRGSTVRLSGRLAETYRGEHARLPASARRPLAQRMVREVLALLGPPVRRAATLWLEAEPPDRRAVHLAKAARVNRREAAVRATEPLGRLLDALEAGGALPG